MTEAVSAAQFACNSCGECCRVHRVPVTHADVARLHRAQATAEPLAFLTWLSPLDIDMEGEPESFVELAVGRRILVLKQTLSDDDGALDAAGERRADCVFWRKNEGCSVYPHRPTTCRGYPFEPETLPQQEGSHPEGQKRVHLRVHPDAACDATTGIQAFQSGATVSATARDLAADDETTRAALTTHASRQRELEEYVALVDAWNRRQKRRRLAGRRAESGEAFVRSLLEVPNVSV